MNKELAARMLSEHVEEQQNVHYSPITGEPRYGHGPVSPDSDGCYECLAEHEPTCKCEYCAYNDPAYLAYCAEEEARGELAYQPETLDCYECAGFNGRDFVTQRVVKLGPVVDRADPTQSYVLACGHTVI